MTCHATQHWPVQNPFVHRRTASSEDIDNFGHVNNVRYIEWTQSAAWGHTDALGLNFEDYQRLGVGCVVQTHAFSYRAPVLEGDEVDVATWIIDNDGRVRMRRGYEIRRADNGGLCFSGETLFVTIDMNSGKPVRMPPEFVAAYKPATPCKS